jgi:hypothetical protein
MEAGMIDPIQPSLDGQGHTLLPDQEAAPMSEAYRDRGPDMMGRLDLIERAMAQILTILERIERRLPDGNAGRERQP